MNLLFHIGRYALLMQRVFSRPEKYSIYRRQILKEIESLGFGSVGIVAFMSTFMGAVLTIQSAHGFTKSWIPSYAIGFATREGIILEFAPTIISLILAGKVGSSIASEIGSMRVSEQIDALEIMGVNSASYLILPKIIACVVFNPIILMISIMLGFIGGWLFGLLTNVVSTAQFVYGIQYEFKPFSVSYAIVKMVSFAFIIASVAAYQSYYTRGGSLQVGQSSTKAVVYCSIFILLANFLLTQLLLA